MKFYETLDRQEAEIKRLRGRDAATGPEAMHRHLKAGLLQYFPIEDRLPPRLLSLLNQIDGHYTAAPSFEVQPNDEGPQVIR